MTRVLIEYYKPDPVEPGAFPLGVLVQDDHAIVYRLFEPERFTLEKYPEFQLAARAETMQNNVLIPSFRRILDDGQLEQIPVSDPGFLDAIASRGDAYFRYGKILYFDDFDAVELAVAIASMPDEHLLKVAGYDTPIVREFERLVG